MASKENDREFQDLWEKNKQSSEKYHALLKTQSNDSQQISEQYMDNKHVLQAHEVDMTYLYGYRDCIKLLKYLGVFSGLEC